MKKEYRPSKQALERYADVMVNFALNRGKGIRKGDVVYLIAYEYSKPLYAEVRKAIHKAGGHVISDYRPDVDDEFNMDREFYELANEQQLGFFPSNYYRGLVDAADHSLVILCDTDMEALKGVDPARLMKRQLSLKQYRDWRNEKENQGKFSWSLCLYGAPAMAKEAGLTLEEYWQQIIRACFLDEKNPVKKWKEVTSTIHGYIKKLNSLEIERVHIQGADADLEMKIGEERQWLGGRGANIPSFEIFTSPDWRGTKGWIRFNQPLYYHGYIVKGIELEFNKGRVVKAKAKQNEKVLLNMIKAKNADKLGEFSMTDGRLSHITKFMAETLYDENIGGHEGNTHVALGAAYHECYSGNAVRMKKKDWEKMGFNDSSVHTDIISTARREITAYLKGGSIRIIYRNGQFRI
jgi:aminopeptidase